jgi:hypothetical protein
MKIKKVKNTTKLAMFAGASALATLAPQSHAQSATAAAGSSAANPPAAAPAAAGLTKPAWLTDLSLGVKEGYDDNIFQVSGLGMSKQSSWITTVSPKVGFNFAPLLGDQKTFKTLSLTYAPEFGIFHEASSESYNAHKINNTIKGAVGDFSFALDNAFLYNDGSKVAEIYYDPATGNANDKYRNNYAHALARERRNQIQDRSTVSLQYDWESFFVRPTASGVDYDLMTDKHKSAGSWTGYQNYVDRYDVNGGADLGYKATKDLSVLLGYRYGHQYQQQLAASIDSDFHHADNDYQRVLLGLEGKPWNWLTVKLSGGPDFRHYNSQAPVSDPNLITYYGDATLTATLTASQSVTFSYKGWQWVGSTGKVPEFDSSYILNYHWNATKQLGFDLGGKFLQADFSSGNDISGRIPGASSSSPSLRNDAQYTVSAGASYAFTSHFSVSLAYAYDMGRSLLNNYSAAPALAASADYRKFDHQTAFLSAQYKF